MQPRRMPNKGNLNPKTCFLDSQRTFPFIDIFRSKPNQLCTLYWHDEAADGKNFKQWNHNLFHLAVKSLFSEWDVCVGRMLFFLFFRTQSNSLTEPVGKWKIMMPFQRSVWERSENSLITLNVRLWFTWHREREAVPTYHKQTRSCSDSCHDKPGV